MDSVKSQPDVSLVFKRSQLSLSKQSVQSWKIVMMMTVHANLSSYAEQITDLKAELKDAQTCMPNLELKIPSYALRMKSSKPFFDVLWPLGRDFWP